jgi:hypothetical protein
VSLTTDLISYWKLDETSGTTAEDSHGSNDGTANNQRVFTSEEDGILGTAADFSSYNDWIGMSNTTGQIDDAGSWSFWVKTSNLASLAGIMGRWRSSTCNVYE